MQFAVNIEDDISQLVPPTFSTLTNKPPQPMVELLWNQQYYPIGEKVSSPNIHMCATCKLPIRIYGRLVSFSVCQSVTSLVAISWQYCICDKRFCYCRFHASTYIATAAPFCKGIIAQVVPKKFIGWRKPHWEVFSCVIMKVCY